MPALDRATSYAFAGRLGAAETLLQRARTADPARARWLAAYIACARGAFADALALATPLFEDAAVGVPALITAGSVLRQTARHGQARDLDRRALLRATTRADRAHALIGLAADAVGLAQPSRVATHLEQAAVATPRGDWRVAVRLSWVRAEHSLLTQDARGAVRWSQAALRRSRTAGARRHEAKSLLFLGAAREVAGDARGAIQPLRDAARIAQRIGAVPIAAVARDVLSRLPG